MQQRASEPLVSSIRLFAVPAILERGLVRPAPGAQMRTLINPGVETQQCFSKQKHFFFADECVRHRV
jgi:hypothetical protein